MKVARVSSYSSSFRSGNFDTNKEVLYPFLYTANPNFKPKSAVKENKFNYVAGFLALCLALASLNKFFGKSSIPKTVVELNRRNAGFNKIDFGQRTTELLKNKILYPMKSLLLGDRNVLNNDFKTGLIIADPDEAKLNNYVRAFIDHAESTGIHIEKIKYPTKKQRIKEVHKALDKAIEYYKQTGECVIVNIGDLAKISNMKISKVESSSNLEKRLAEMPKGILWTAWTTAGEKLPYFYNNIPTLSVKIVD